MLLVALGGLCFLIAVAVQLLAYDRVLKLGLRSAQLEVRRRALGRWAALLLGWQLLALLGIGLYALLLPRSLRAGYAWVAPPLGLVLGTALPLQLAVLALARRLRD